MAPAFYISAVIAVISTVLMITRLHAVHALIYLVVSLLAVATVFYTLGAPFVAALEVIIYAGAIMVLFIFVTMLLNIGKRAVEIERAWLDAKAWIGPSILAAILAAELFYILFAHRSANVRGEISPQQVGIALYGPYLLGVELVSMLLLAGVVGAYHLGWNAPGEVESTDDSESGRQRDAAGGDLVRSGADRPGDTP
ncbi:MAG TPA: NADH-quinone oxidoreductase subunit J [Bryobacteraceae bacterium]